MSRSSAEASGAAPAVSTQAQGTPSEVIRYVAILPGPSAGGVTASTGVPPPPHPTGTPELTQPALTITSTSR